MKFKFLNAAFAGLLLAVTSIANAGLITSSVTFDLSSTINNSNTWNNSFYLLDSPVTVNNGDTVKFTIDFLGEQYLNFGPNQFYAWMGYSVLAGDLGGFSMSNLSVNFLNLSNGSQYTAAHLASQSMSSCCAHLGPYINSDGTSRSFSGVEVMFDVAFTDGDVDREYNRVWSVPIFSGAISYGVAEVPEPTTLAIFALGMIGLASRRFKKQS